MSGFKKFELSYKKVPQVFNLPESVFYKKTAELIPEDSLAQTEEQRTEVAGVINQLKLDRNRTCYVAFDGLTAAELKAHWLSINLDKTSLAPGVFPSFTQGDDRGASVGDMIHSNHFFMPVSEQDPASFESLYKNTIKISFAYQNKQQKPAGFFIIASPKGSGNGNHIGWIISSIQNTTAKLEDRKVTVLSSENYIPFEADTTFDESSTLQNELKNAIQNEKIYALLMDVFLEDGSLNEEYLKELNQRITAAINIDDRDSKANQLKFLQEWIKKYPDEDFQQKVSAVLNQMNEDIHFFKDSVFQTVLDDLCTGFAEKIKKQTSTDKSQAEIKIFLNTVLDKLIQLEKLSEKVPFEIEKANTFKAITEKVKQDVLSINFDGTKDDDTKISFLRELQVEEISKKVNDYYNTNPEIKEIIDNKQTACDSIETDLIGFHRDRNVNSISRNRFEIGFAVTVGLVGAALAFTGVLGLLAAAIVVASLIIATGIKIFFKEKKYFQKLDENIEEYSQNLEQSKKDLNLDIYLMPVMNVTLTNIESKETGAQVDISSEAIMTHDLKSLWENRHKDAEARHAFDSQYGLSIPTNVQTMAGSSTTVPESKTPLLNANVESISLNASVFKLSAFSILAPNPRSLWEIRHNNADSKHKFDKQYGLSILKK